MSYAVPVQAPIRDTFDRPRLRVKKLSLRSFRNYADLRLDLSPAPVLLTGANGSGKTNLLEAISLIVPGRGMRHARMHDLQNSTHAEAWAAAVEIESPAGDLCIGTGRDPGDPHGERRALHIDGKAARQTDLAEHVAMAWITPDMDRLLAEGAAARRKLLDRLVYSFDPAHRGRAHRYEKCLRERLRLLRDGPVNAAWLSALEDDMARTGVAVAAARRHLVQELGGAMDDISGAFPRADLALSGVAEDALAGGAALPVEDMLRAAYARTRSEDAQTGTCAIGPHRSDLLVGHRDKACPAHLCSTGEQKALLIAIMLAYVRTLCESRNMTPVFLLDDIAAHLDETRRAALFDEILALGAQTWVTGTDAGAFDGFLPSAQHFVIENGAVLRG